MHDRLPQKGMCSGYVTCLNRKFSHWFTIVREKKKMDSFNKVLHTWRDQTRPVHRRAAQLGNKW